MISRKFKYSVIAIGIVMIMIASGAYGVVFIREYDTNAPVADDEWNQYRWPGEAWDGIGGGAAVVGGANYKGGQAIQLPPGGFVSYNLIFPPAPGATMHVKHGVYRLFLYASTNTTGGLSGLVHISVYVDFMFIQIDTTNIAPYTGVQSPAANGHCGVIDVGWIDFSDELHNRAPPPGNYHWIEIANTGAGGNPNTITIDEVIISTAN
jgi:hypothetical protein